MPRKDRKEYNEYMRNYQRNKKKKAEKNTPDFNGEEVETLDITKGTPKELIDISKKVLKDPETGKPDKVIQYIEQGAKYLPLIMKFAEGFISNMREFNAKNPQKEEKRQSIKPPEGWVSMSPMEKLKYKHTRPEWYNAGLKWDSYQETGMINSEIDIGHVDPTYTEPRRGQVPVHNDSEPKSLRELSQRHPEPPLINDDAPVPVSAESNQALHDPKFEEAVKNKQKRHEKKVKEENKDDKKVPEQGEVIEMLQQDNAKYVKIAIDYIGAMDMEMFQSKVDSLDKVMGKIKPLLILIPIHVVDMIKATPDNELMQLFKENCSDKYEWCEKNDKLKKITEMFNKLKEMI